MKQISLRDLLGSGRFYRLEGKSSDAAWLTCETVILRGDPPLPIHHEASLIIQTEPVRGDYVQVIDHTHVVVDVPDWVIPGTGKRRAYYLFHEQGPHLRVSLLILKDGVVNAQSEFVLFTDMLSQISLSRTMMEEFAEVESLPSHLVLAYAYAAFEHIRSRLV